MPISEPPFMLPSETAFDRSAHRILVVDDDEDTLSILEMFFSRQGYVLDHARDGEEALDLLRRHRHDLVISDVMMPVMDGLRFCECVRSDPEVRMTPIILVTAKSETAHKLLALEKGADDYVVKPVNLFELSARAASTLRQRKLRETVYAQEKELERVRTLERTLGVISHHINNAIAPIYGRAQMCEPRDADQSRKLVETCLESCRRVTRTLQVLGKVIAAMKDPSNPERYDLVERSMKEVAEHLDRKIEAADKTTP
jgi:CheY-like chemotaxis protein